ncbi:MAG: dihydropteroate synthase [Candidatus Anammoximicrobium sp.]|nr:dihydropteroate synthase [Candidatus Anammoximicrobium sp.]
MEREHIHFITGRLAEHALRSVLEPLAEAAQFDYSVAVMPISVAALMTPVWIARHIAPPPHATRILLPGYCAGDTGPIDQRVQIPVAFGPRDLRQLPEFFGRSVSPRHPYGDFDIEILAEINHAPRLSLEQIRVQARQLATAGADLIDVGCEPGEPWRGAAECVRALRDDGHRVSIDSWNPAEIEPAVRAGAELVLSVNRANRDAAPDWGCEVVVIPDDFATLGGLDETIDRLSSAAVPFRIDPVLEPIGLGLAASLDRYLEVRRRYPAAAMLMGIGNLTELTDVDSAGVNVLLLGFCQELGIRSVLTTQVINWARSSVRECDLARRLVHYAVRQGVPPKHLEPRLVALRDPQLHEFGGSYFERLAGQLKDHNYRLFAEGGRIHLVCAGLHLEDADPFQLFARLLATQPQNVDPSHAFYLGYEMAKALTALTLSKDYRQDDSLDWGHLTVPEASHRR